MCWVWLTSKANTTVNAYDSAAVAKAGNGCKIKNYFQSRNFLLQWEYLLMIKGATEESR